jgi:hypothetical protein
MMVPFVTSQDSLARQRLLLDTMATAGLAVCFFVVLLKEPGVQRGLLAFAYLTLLLFIAVHDIRSLRVPNWVVYPALGFSMAASLTLRRFWEARQQSCYSWSSPS